MELKKSISLGRAVLAFPPPQEMGGALLPQVKTKEVTEGFGLLTSVWTQNTGSDSCLEKSKSLDALMVHAKERCVLGMFSLCL